MILDRLEQAGLYHPLHPGLVRAFAFLCTTDCLSLPVGRHELDGDRLFANVDHYQPRPLEPRLVFESHRRYLDVQYVAAGAERIGYLPLSAQPAVTQAYDADRDLALYQAAGTLLEMSAGSFAIFYPHDVHAPGIAPAEGPAGQVVKVVVKVAVDW